jgi:hypothetical protein
MDQLLLFSDAEYRRPEPAPATPASRPAHGHEDCAKPGSPGDRLPAGHEPPADPARLFSDEVVSANRWRDCLAAADLDGAEAVLHEQTRIFPTLAAGARPGREAALAGLRNVLTLPRPECCERLAVLVRAWREEPWLSGLLPEAAALDCGLWRALQRALPVERTAPFANGLWPAQVLVRAADWGGASRRIARSLHEHGELAFLRQLQAWVWHRQDRQGPARIALAMALCNAAADCRPEYLPEDCQTLLAQARESLGEDSPAAWQALAFEAWRQGLLGFPSRHSPYEIWLSQQVQTRPGSCDRSARGQYFLRLLYLAEAARCRGQAPAQVLDWRTSMKALLPKRFREYMAMVEASP